MCIWNDTYGDNTPAHYTITCIWNDTHAGTNVMTSMCSELTGSDTLSSVVLIKGPL